ncbi:MAG TPA: hypothetical protein VFH56_11835 [Acidimicrobiales bacterium]|nr:hypothetical protein [Acidimicrobiales bacterium]
MADQPNSGAAARVESGGFRAKGCRHSGTGDGCHAIDFEDALAVADSVLYEATGPYPHVTAASGRRVRRPVGVLAPRAWVDSRLAPAGGVEVVSVRPESWWNQTECLLEADLDARMEVRLRYMQLTDDLAGSPSDGIAGPAGGTVRREASVAFTLEELVGSGIVVTVDGGGLLQARFLVSASTPPSPFEVYRITVRVENAVRLNADDVGMSREEVLRRSLISAHLLLGVGHGAFLSSIDPPDWATVAAGSCRNVGSFPVLAGRWGTSAVVLSAPMNLYDHPRLVAVPRRLASGL